MEPAIAADIEHAGAGQIRGQRWSNVLPLDVGKVAQKMMRRGPNPIQIDVVEPVTFFSDTACEFLVAVKIRSFSYSNHVRACCHHRLTANFRCQCSLQRGLDSVRGT